MQRLIDADAYLEAMRGEYPEYFEDVLDEQPTIDAVPVIRCKDCKYNSNTEGNYVNCDIIPQMFGKTPDYNYCSRAERRGEE